MGLGQDFRSLDFQIWKCGSDINGITHQVIYLKNNFNSYYCKK